MDYLFTAYRHDGREVAARTLEMLLEHIYTAAYKDVLAQLPLQYKAMFDNNNQHSELDPIQKHWREDGRCRYYDP